MDYSAWLENDWNEAERFSVLEKEMTFDLGNQLESAGLKLLSSAYRPFALSIVAENEDGTKWLNIVTEDVRKNDGWFDRVSLRRMSSPKDWKGKALHFCKWDELDEKAREYFGDEYDDEIL